MKVSIIVAKDFFGVIGKMGKLPWRLPEDLKMFRTRTMGHAIIMGHNTWKSLPKKPLDGRANIVISRNTWDSPVSDDGPYFYSSLEVALYTINNCVSGSMKKYKDKEKVFIIGGSTIYRDALEKDLVDEIIITKIKKEYEGDVFFPQLSSKWEVTMMSAYTDFDVLYMEKKHGFR